MNEFYLPCIAVFVEISESFFYFRFLNKVEVCGYFFRGILMFELRAVVCMRQIIQQRACLFDFIYVLRLYAEPFRHHIERNGRTTEVQIYMVMRTFQNAFFVIILIVTDKSITLDCFVTFDNIDGRLFEVRKIIHNLTFLAAQNLLFFRFHFLTPRNQEIFSHFSHFFPRLGQALPREIRKIVFIEKSLMSYGVYAISLLPLFIKIFPVFPIFPIF